jgi:hypothetical protein
MSPNAPRKNDPSYPGAVQSDMGRQRRVEAGRGSRVGKTVARAIASPMSICEALRLEIFRIYHLALADHEWVTLQDSSVGRANKIGFRFQNGYYEFTFARLSATHSGFHDFSSVPEGDSSNPPSDDGPTLCVRSQFFGCLVKLFRFFRVTYCRNKKLHRTPFAHPTLEISGGSVSDYAPLIRG